MDEHTTFLILSRVGERDAIPITGRMDITIPRGIQRDPNLIELLEGKLDVASSYEQDTGH